MDHVSLTVSGSWVERGIIIVHMNESCVVAYLGRIRSVSKLIASKWHQHDSNPENFRNVQNLLESRLDTPHQQTGSGFRGPDIRMNPLATLYIELLD